MVDNGDDDSILPPMDLGMVLTVLASLTVTPSPRNGRHPAPSLAQLLQRIGDEVNGDQPHLSASERRAHAALRRELCAGSSSHAATISPHAPKRTLPLIILCMQRHREIADVQAQGCRALRYLCMGDHVHVMEAIGCGAVETIVAALDAFSQASTGEAEQLPAPLSTGTTEVLRWACAALKCLAWSRQAPRDLFLEAGAVGAIMIAIRTYRKPSVLSEAVLALENLCFDEDGVRLTCSVTNPADGFRPVHISKCPGLTCSIHRAPTAFCATVCQERCRQHAAEAGLLSLLLEVFAPVCAPSCAPYQPSDRHSVAGE